MGQQLSGSVMKSSSSQAIVAPKPSTSEKETPKKDPIAPKSSSQPLAPALQEAPKKKAPVESLYENLSYHEN